MFDLLHSRSRRNVKLQLSQAYISLSQANYLLSIGVFYLLATSLVASMSLFLICGLALS